MIHKSGQFWSTLVNFCPVLLSGYSLLILDRRITKRISLEFICSDLLLISKRNRRQRVLRLSPEVCVHREQLFR